MKKSGDGVFTILIAGYYGYGNIGDELILKTLLECLAGRFPGVGLSVLYKSGSGFKKYINKPDIRFYGRYNPFHIFYAMFICDILVLGGGGLFQDKTGLKTVLYYSFLVLTARLLRKKIFLVSNSFGPFLTETAKQITYETLKLADWITVREKLSEKHLIAAGVKKYKLTTDLLYLSSDFTSGTKTTRPGTKKRDSIIFIPNYHTKPETIGILKKWLSQNLYRIVPVLFFFGDIMTLKELGLEETGVNPDIEELKTGFSSACFTISFRLHGAILSELSLTPYLLIGDDEKFGGLAKEDLYLSESGLSYSALEKKLAYISGSRDELSSEIAARLGGKRILAENNLEYLQDIISGR